MILYFLTKPFRRVLTGTAFAVTACLGILNSTAAQNIKPSDEGIIYVKKQDPNSNDGSSWDKAHYDLAAVLHYAKTGNTVREIRVAEGTYYPLQKVNAGSSDSRDYAFVLAPGVKVYGGYPKEGGDDRDWSKNPTVLSGELAGGNNAYHAVICDGNSDAAYIDGFTVTKGKADGETGNAIGGGIYCNNASLVIANVIISDNVAKLGGGIYCNNASLVITNVTISNNRAISGGGIYNNLSSPVMTNVTISDNEATADGEGIYNTVSSPKFFNSIIWNNDISDNTSTPSYTNSLVEGIDTESPMFVEGSYQLELLSPAVNAGSESAYFAARGIAGFAGEKDLAGKPRKTGQSIDMGAYENQTVPVITITDHPSDTAVTRDTVSGSLRVTANVDRNVPLIYQWYRIDSDNDTVSVDGGTGTNCAIHTGLTEGIYYYYVTVSARNAADVTSEKAKVTVKVHQPKPSLPVAADSTDTSITLEEVNGAEYRIDITDSVWKDERIFGNLTPNTEYTLYIRYRETVTKYASPPSQATIKTRKATLDGEITIIGVAGFNQTLSVDTGKLKTNVPRYRDFGTLYYQWKYYTENDTLTVPDATDPTFRITGNDIIGKRICVRIKAANVGGEITAFTFAHTPGGGGGDSAGDTVVVSRGALTVDDLLISIDSAWYDGSLRGDTVTYDGSAHGVWILPDTGAGVAGIGKITVKYNGSTTKPTDAGKYGISIDVSDGTNYIAATDLKSDTFVIAQAPLTPDKLQFAPDTVIYSGSEQGVESVSASAGVTGVGGTITVTYKDKDNNTVTPVNAGSYAVTVDVSGGTNYLAAKDLTLSDRFVIDRATVTAADLQFTSDTIAVYDGTAKSVTVSSLKNELENETFTVKYIDAKGVETSPVDVGKYRITVDFPGSTNYKPVEGLSTGNLTIERGVLTADKFRFSPDTSIYNGSAQSVDISEINVTGAGEITVKYNGSTAPPTDAGKYGISIDVSDGGTNYVAATDLKLDTFVIAQAPLTPDKLQFAPDTVIYSGLEQGVESVSASAGVTGVGGTITVTYKDKDNNTVTPVNAGSYAVTVDVSGGTNYLAAKDLTLPDRFVIDRATVTAADLQFTSDTIAVYDGTAKGVTVLPPDDETFTVKYIDEKGVETSPVEVGKYKITVDFPGSTNYKPVEGLFTGNLTIERGVLTADKFRFSPDTLIYNGSAQSVDISEINVTGAGEITVKYNGSTAPPTNAGKYGITIDVSDGGTNYIAATDLKLDTFVIAKASLASGNFTVSPTGATYDGSAKEVAVSLNDDDVKGAGTVIAVRYDGNETPPTDAGKYGITIDVSDGVNYHVATGLSLDSFEIEKADIIASDLRFATDTLAFYDGSAKSVKVSTSNTKIDIASSVIKYNKTEGSATYPVNAGKYAVTVDIPGSANYRIAEGLHIGNLTIGKAALTAGDFTFTPDSKPYSGSGQGVSVSINGNIDGAGSRITVKYDGRTELPVLPGEYRITVDVSGDGVNYREATGINPGSFVITRIARLAPFFPPVLKDKTATRVTLGVVSNAQSQYQSQSQSQPQFQYRNGSAGEWQDSPVFTGLSPNTEYTFYVRTKEDEIYNPSPASAGLKTVTDDAPNYGISLLPSGNHTFGTVEYGYGEPQSYSVEVGNIGANPTGMLSISLSGEGNSAFVLSKNFVTGLEPGDADGFSLTTKPGLAPGVYLATVTVGNGVNGVSASFDAGFTVTKISQSAPPSLEAASLSPTRVILKTISGAEYCNGSGEWQNSPIFDGLVPSTAYTFHARYRGSDVREASPPGEGLPVVTPLAPDRGIALNPSGNYTFPSDVYGYRPQTYMVIVNNVGNLPTGTLLITLSGDHGNRFTLSHDSISSLEPAGTTAIFTVKPKPGLAIGDYSATVTLSGINNLSASFAVNFTVDKARLPAPAAPTLKSSSATNITLNTVAGAQYRNGATGEWQDSPSFNGLIPNTEYTFYMRMKAVEAHDASLAGDVFTVSTGDAPDYGIVLLPSGNCTFPPVDCGYVPPAAHTAVISNIGNRSTGALNVSLGGEGNGGFTLSTIFIDSIAPMGYKVFTVAPKPGLAPGVYPATVTVSGINGLSSGFDVSITVNKASQDAPAAPELFSEQTSTRVILKTVAGVEYRNSNGEWQDSPMFDGLAPNTDYVFYARKKATAMYETGPSSEGLSIRTRMSPNYGVALNPAGNYAFPPDTCGYLSQTPYKVIVSNIGSLPTNALLITLSGASGNRFILSRDSIDNIEPGGIAVFTLEPKTGLAIGDYGVTVTLSGINSISASFDASFTVNKARLPVPPAPALASRSATNITLTTVAGAQYRNGTTGEWQDSPSFNGLIPNTEYTFYMRMRAVEKYDESFAGDPLPVSTTDTPNYGIALLPSGNCTFPPVDCGYVPPAAHSAVISNIGNRSTGALNVSLGGAGNGGFTLSRVFVDSIAPTDYETFAVAPKTGLAPGVYTATVAVNGANGLSGGFDVSITVNKASQDAPAAPELFAAQTSTRVILRTVAGVEYRNGNGEWQDSPMFDGLAPNTDYVFYARKKATAMYETGPSSEGLPVHTEMTPNYGVALNPAGNYTFPPDTCGYLSQTPYKILVSNIGSLPTNALLITLSGSSGNRFILSNDNIENIEPGAAAVFTLEPKTGLAIGDYGVTVTLSGINDISASFDASFTVNKARLPVPPAPALASRSATNITLKTVAGAQYRNGTTGEWQDSPSFNGLIPNTEYTFYMRMRAVEKYDESFAGDPLPVSTTDTPNYGIALLPSGNCTFPATDYGYGAQTGYSVVISNIGNRPAGALNISLNGEGNGGFVLSKVFIDSILTGGRETFTITPATALVPGVYPATVTVAGVNDLSASFDVKITVNKASQEAPATPALSQKTATGVILTPVAGAEYRNGSGEWQNSEVFEGLVPDTAYVFYARKKETATHEASPASDALSVTTSPTPEYGISLNPSGNHTFASDTCGYASQPRYAVRVTNVGNQPTDRLDITLSGDNHNRFTSSAPDINSLDPGESSVFTLVPVNGLDSGTYIAKVTVGNARVAGSESNISVNFDVNFRVNQARQLTPPAPEAEHITATTVTLVEIPGAEYRMGNGEWQESEVFQGLTPYSTYSFYARMKETATHLPSPSSGSLTATTLDTRTEILRFVINGVHYDVSDTIEYRAGCNENQVDLELTVPATATVSVDGEARDMELNGDVNIDNVRLDNDLTYLPIEVRAQDSEGRNRKYVLKLYRMLDGNKLLFQRWDNVLAINTNPANNGDYDTVSGVRWYRSYDDGFDNHVSDGWYIKLTNGFERYQALVLIEGQWYQECGEPTVRSFEKVLAYPNPVPAGDNLNLHLPEHLAGGYLNVHTLSGSTVKRKLPLPDKNNIINVSDLSPGIYLLNITGPDGNRETVKIIVN